MFAAIPALVANIGKRHQLRFGAVAPPLEAVSFIEPVTLPRWLVSDQPLLR
jgi:hypothetical protein